MKKSSILFFKGISKVGVLSFGQSKYEPHWRTTLTYEHEQASLFGWTKNKSYNILHATSWNIFNIYFSIWILLSDVVEYFAMSHPWFVPKWIMVCWFWTRVWPRKLSTTTLCECVQTLLLI
jgi:hypothetical protein